MIKRFIFSKLNLFLFLIIDCCILFLSLKLSFLIRFNIFESVFSKEILWNNDLWEKYTGFFSYFFLIYFCVLQYFGFYEKKIGNTVRTRIKTVFYAAIAYIMIIFLISFYLRFIIISRIFYAIYLSVLILFNLARSLFIESFLSKFLFNYDLTRKNIVFAGFDHNRHFEIVSVFSKENGYKVLGYFSDEPDIDEISGEYKCLGRMNELKEYVSKNHDGFFNVIILLDSKRRNEILNLISICLEREIEVSVLQDTGFVKAKHIAIDEIESIPLIKL